MPLPYALPTPYLFPLALPLPYAACLAPHGPSAPRGARRPPGLRRAAAAEVLVLDPPERWDAGGADEFFRVRAAPPPPACLPPPPPSRTNWARLVPPSVLTGHVSSLLLPLSRKPTPLAASSLRIIDAPAHHCTRHPRPCASLRTPSAPVRITPHAARALAGLGGADGHLRLHPAVDAGPPAPARAGAPMRPRTGAPDGRGNRR